MEASKDSDCGRNNSIRLNESSIRRSRDTTMTGFEIKGLNSGKIDGERTQKEFNNCKSSELARMSTPPKAQAGAGRRKLIQKMPAPLEDDLLRNIRDSESPSRNLHPVDIPGKASQRVSHIGLDSQNTPLGLRANEFLKRFDQEN